MTPLQSLRSVDAAARVALAVVLAAAFAPAATAQTPREAIGDLIPGSTPTEVSAVASAVVMQIASVPIGSSSGAFTLVRDAATGEVSLKTFGFGPSFAERPSTLGKAGAFTFGTNYQRTAFRTFEGVSLSGGLRAEVRLDGRPVRELFATSLDVSTGDHQLHRHARRDQGSRRRGQRALGAALLRGHAHERGRRLVGPRLGHPRRSTPRASATSWCARNGRPGRPIAARSPRPSRRACRPAARTC